MAAARRATTKDKAPAKVEQDAATGEIEPAQAAEDEPGSAEDPPPEQADPAPLAPEPDPDAALRETADYLKGLFEALLFVADHPVELKELSRAAKVDRKRAAEILALLRADYEARGLVLDEVAEGFQFRSSPRYAGFVRNFLTQRPVRLSRAQLETLAIVAYRQPITRPEIDEIRGVDCGPVLKGLLERDLIKILGKKDEPGRPLLYGTAQNFLELFSLTSLSQLPTLREFTELSDESRRSFERQIGEEAPEGPMDLESPAPSTEQPTSEPAPESTESETSATSEDRGAEVAADEDDEDEDEDDDDEDDDDDDDDDDDR